MTGLEKKRERPHFEIKLADGLDERQACLDIRTEGEPMQRVVLMDRLVAVFIVEQGFSMDDEIDQYEDISHHLLLTISEPAPSVTSSSLLPASSTTATSPGSSTTRKPVGTIRFVPSLGKVTRLAVDAQYRKYGFGKELVLAIDEHLRQCTEEQIKDIVSVRDGKRWARLKCHSQIPVVGFYAKLGYRKEGPEFDEDGAPHQKMIKDVCLADERSQV